MQKSLKDVTVVKNGASDAIIREFHSSGIGAHGGFNKTNNAIRLRYWWPQMTVGIKHFVKQCIQCQKSDPMKPAKKPDLQQIHVERPFELVGCDLMGPFQETASGFKYIFTATDYYTKWVEAFPIQSKSAKDVSACLKKLLYRHGAMNAILTDQGREFLNEINKNLCKEWDVSHRVTAAYHPQTNGLDERTNQTIKRALSKCVNEGQTDWDEHLDPILFALRTKQQASTKYSPFFLLHGREALYPSELPACFGSDENVPSCPPDHVIIEDVKAREDKQAGIKESVKFNTDKAKEKQQRDFKNANEKKNRRFTNINVGDKVFKFNSARAGKKSKADLGCSYSGPYIVEEIVGQRLKIKKDDKTLKNLVSINNVKIVIEKNKDTTTQQDKVTSDTMNIDNPLEEPAAYQQENTNSRDDKNMFVDNLVANNMLDTLFKACGAINKTTKMSLDLNRFSRTASTCPVMSLICAVTRTDENLVDVMRDAVLRKYKVVEEGDFTGRLILISCVLAKAYMEDLPPVDVLQTLTIHPEFLSKCTKPKGLTGNERITVAGDGLEQQDLNTLKGNNWINDKVLNGYAKLLAREANDSSDSSAKRTFVIPSYTAVLWDAGIYDKYMYRKVDFTLYDLIVVPWNKNENHWVVLVARPNDLTVTVFDSLGADNSQLIAHFCQFMRARSEIVKDGLHHWKPMLSTTNKQTDGSSCGVFALMTIECLAKGKASWILLQVHVQMFRSYVTERLLLNGDRNTILCDSFSCKDPRGKQVKWIQCDICYRWWHELCCSKTLTKFDKEQYQCDVCEIQYSYVFLNVGGNDLRWDSDINSVFTDIELCTDRILKECKSVKGIWVASIVERGKFPSWTGLTRTSFNRKRRQLNKLLKEHFEQCFVDVQKSVKYPKHYESDLVHPKYGIGLKLLGDIIVRSFKPYDIHMTYVLGTK